MNLPRKIQLTGGNTYTVSLPHEWIDRLKIKKGDHVYITDNTDGTLTFSTKQTKSDTKVYTINITEGTHATMRNIVAAYIGGATKIVLKGKGTAIVAEQARQILSGVEIIEENDEGIVLSIVKFDDLDIDDIMKREFNVTKSMFGLVSDVCRGHGNLVEVSKKEEAVDRLYILVLRNLILSATKQKEAIFKAVVAKSIEKVGDHLVDLCKSAEDAGRSEWLADLVDCACDVYTQAFETFAKNEPNSKNFKNAMTKYKEIYHKADAILKKEKNVSKMLILLILLEKCNKVIRYSEDIMESNTDIIFARMESEEKD
ncbi:MAG: phosphate uptake regulator PhoU [Candidatus Micrarchaeota archaeon]